MRQKPLATLQYRNSLPSPDQTPCLSPVSSNVKGIVWPSDSLATISKGHLSPRTKLGLLSPVQHKITSKSAASHQAEVFHPTSHAAIPSSHPNLHKGFKLFQSLFTPNEFKPSPASPAPQHSDNQKREKVSKSTAGCQVEDVKEKNGGEEREIGKSAVRDRQMSQEGNLEQLLEFEGKNTVRRSSLLKHLIPHIPAKPPSPTLPPPPDHVITPILHFQAITDSDLSNSSDEDENIEEVFKQVQSMRRMSLRVASNAVSVRRMTQLLTPVKEEKMGFGEVAEEFVKKNEQLAMKTAEVLFDTHFKSKGSKTPRSVPMRLFKNI